MKCRQCSKTLPKPDDGFWCPGCFKVKFCSDECELANTDAHQRLCNIVQHLKSNVSGFNDRLFSRFAPGHPQLLSPAVYEELYRFGLAYVPMCRDRGGGAVCFRIHPIERFEALERKLDGTQSSATVMRNPTQGTAVHYFAMPLLAIAKMLKPVHGREAFIQLCKRDDLSELGCVPMVQVREFTEDGEPALNISVYATVGDEFR